MARTMAELAREVGLSASSIEKRARNYPINAPYIIIGRGRVYEPGVLEAWHERVTRSVERPSHAIAGAIAEGAKAYRRGESYGANPHSKVDDIAKFCAWCAGFNDEKSIDSKLDQ